MTATNKLFILLVTITSLSSYANLVTNKEGLLVIGELRAVLKDFSMALLSAPASAASFKIACASAFKLSISEVCAVTSAFCSSYLFFVVERRAKLFNSTALILAVSSIVILTNTNNNTYDANIQELSNTKTSLQGVFLYFV
jgi:hypothetical protein